MIPFMHRYALLLLLLVTPLSRAAGEPHAAGKLQGQYDADRSLAKSQAVIGARLDTFL